MTRRWKRRPIHLRRRTEPVISRDRDEFGRPRNARPRDRLGRPLPHDYHGPDAIEGVPEDLNLPPAETLAYAQRLIDDGLAFSAHEVFEAAWKSCPPEERMLWQGLAQLAVGVTHIQRGNRKGAVTVLQRASVRLAVDEAAPPYAIDIPGLLNFAAGLIDDVTAGLEIAPEQLHPRFVV